MVKLGTLPYNTMQYNRIQYGINGYSKVCYPTVAFSFV